MTQEKERVYSPTDVQELLKIDSSTLRKYAILLEKHGYIFLKNDRGHRGYFDKDIITLRKLIEFSKQQDMTLERSAKAVLTWVPKDDVTVNATNKRMSDPHIERYNDILKRLIYLEDYTQKQDVFQKKLLAQLQKQQQYIQDSLEKRDQALMTSIRDLQQEKRVLIEQAASQEKKPWWRFW
ncbi:DUF3967 domain-containing protein [Bacillus thuringiensis]|uniref:DUF3967 domain-containing protein n=1 Tax=Bacillus thuringiensis TaxID=1428 RepID=UPI0011A4ADD1|nr:DUF3967 domain-containing protein [Bacillus thuringiensis]